MVRVALAAVLITAAGTVHAMQVRAEVDRERIYLDESVNLILTAEGAEVKGTPDLVPLQQDFDVLGQSTQTNIKYENRQYYMIYSWVIEIKPRNTGTIQIPGITIGTESTNPLELTVEQFTGNRQSVGADIFLEVEAHPLDPYVQSQVIFTVRLFADANIPQGSLSKPEVTFGLMEQLGRDRRYRSNRANRDYQVIEKRFALFPEQSGPQTIPSVEFAGIVARGNTNTMQTEFTRERVSSDSIAIQVRPKPVSFSGTTWLPAQDLKLVDSWDGRLPEIVAGRPESRKISIQAEGLRAVQLPSPEYESNQTVRVYGTNPELKTTHTARSTVGQRDEEFAIIPSTLENLVVPAFRVVWWDVNEDREKVAELPPIAASPVAAETSAGGESAISLQASPSTDEPRSLITVDTSVWMLISLGMLFMWLLTLVGWYVSRRMNRMRDAEIQERDARRELTRRQSLRSLRRACRENDPVRVADALLGWSKLNWAGNSPGNLIELGVRVGNEEFSQELERLDRRLYSGGSDEWSGDRLWKLFLAIRPGVSAELPNKRKLRLFSRSEKTLDDIWFDQELSVD